MHLHSAVGDPNELSEALLKAAEDVKEASSHFIIGLLDISLKMEHSGIQTLYNEISSILTSAHDGSVLGSSLWITGFDLDLVPNMQDLMASAAKALRKQLCVCFTSRINASLRAYFKVKKE